MKLSFPGAAHISKQALCIYYDPQSGYHAHTWSPTDIMTAARGSQIGRQIDRKLNR